MQRSRGAPRSGDRAIAGDRPPRYGSQNGPFYRRARACPSPCSIARETSSHARMHPRAPRYGPGRKNARGTGPRAPVIERSRGTGPRATVSGTARFIVGRGPVPRHAPIARETRAPVIERSRGTGPRATVSGTASFIVGRGPVPRHARSRGKPARMRVWHPRGHARRGMKRSRGTGPRATVAKTAILAVSPRQTSSASDWPQKQDPATTASLMSPAYHQTQLPQSDSNTQHPASPTYR